VQIKNHDRQTGGSVLLRREKKAVGETTSLVKTGAARETLKKHDQGTKKFSTTQKKKMGSIKVLHCRAKEKTKKPRGSGIRGGGGLGEGGSAGRAGDTKTLGGRKQNPWEREVDEGKTGKSGQIPVRGQLVPWLEIGESEKQPCNLG